MGGSPAGDCGSQSRTWQIRIVLAGRQNQQAGRLRSPEEDRQPREEWTERRFPKFLVAAALSVVNFNRSWLKNAKPWNNEGR
jgi:hypothetical protein